MGEKDDDIAHPGWYQDPKKHLPRLNSAIRHGHTRATSASWLSRFGELAAVFFKAKFSDGLLDSVGPDRWSGQSGKELVLGAPFLHPEPGQFLGSGGPRPRDQTVEEPDAHSAIHRRSVIVRLAVGGGSRPDCQWCCESPIGS